MPNLTTLPQWAQKHIHQLERELEHVKAQLRQVEGKEGSNVSMQDGLHLRPLPQDAAIYFWVKGTPSAHSFISCRLKDKAVYINAGHSIVITPEASNAITVEMDEG